ncbi:MAG: hypothetical protein IJ994_08570, partial [Firmicutes bacterium]|nr:hypothetical protein [Bacillota bacterium]
VVAGFCAQLGGSGLNNCFVDADISSDSGYAVGIADFSSTGSGGFNIIDCAVWHEKLLKIY